jgi:DNA-binding CsgD family transcriptional regulator
VSAQRSTTPTAGQVDSVLFLDDQDYSPAEIAEVVGATVEQVRLVLGDRAVIEGRAPAVEPAGQASRKTGRPRLLTDQQVAEAAVLRADGASYRSIGERLHCSPETVRSALIRPAAEPEPVEGGTRPESAAQPAEPRAETWPPPATDRTRWSTVEVPTGARTIGQRTHRAVPVRSVLLWGRSVLVNAEGDAWCPHCQRFLDAAELQRPGAHPVGLPYPSGPFPIDLDAPTPGEPLGPLAGGFRDLMRTPW